MASFNDGVATKRLTLSAFRFSPLQRAYLIGFRRARNLARRDANAFADRFEAVNGEVHVMLHGVRREMARMRAIDHALEAERNDTLWLNESAQGSRPVGFSTDLKSAALSPPRVSLISRVMGILRTWRRRELERGELARMSQSELHDIGCSSSEHWAEISKPFWRK